MSSPIPSLLYGDVERDLRTAVRDVLADQADWTSVLARVDSDQPYDDHLWKILARDLGLAGLLIPEDAGGQGGTAREAAVVLEELGRAVAPVPYLASAVVATTVLLRCGTSAWSLLSALAVGEQTATLAVAATTPPGAPFAAVRAEPQGDVVHVSGELPAVLAGDLVDTLVVPCLHLDRPLVVAVETKDQGVRLRRATSLDPTRPIVDMTLDRASGGLLVEGDMARTAVDHALLVGAALLASEQLGVAERALSMTVDYLKDRRQFGRPIGSFQALKHRVADLWAEVNNARAAARYAAACLAEDSADVPVAASMAKAYCSQVALQVAEECVQLHGGIGFTWEHPAHLYLKRAMAQSLMFGAADQHHALLADQLDLPAAFRLAE